MKSNNIAGKGHLMEESLRMYFLGRGFYVLRGVELTYKNMLATDIDLWLYNRPSSLTRERINVDIKTKKVPQAAERIFWTKGVQQILGFDDCVVATSDKRPIIKEFGDKYGVIVLDGNFLKKLKLQNNAKRFSEEEFIDEIMRGGMGKLSDNWPEIVKFEKTELLKSLDYGGCILTLENINIIIENCITIPYRKNSACRILYLLISYFLIKLDYLLKDLAFYDDENRKILLNEGLKYGNFGEAGLQNIISMAKKVSDQEGNKQIETYLDQEYNNLLTELLADYFSEYDVVNKLFLSAKKFEHIAFLKEFTQPDLLPIELKAIIGIILDYFNIKRIEFFEIF